MSCDFVKLDFASVVFFGVFYFVGSFLDGVEALYLVLSHCILFTCYCWNVLNETNHGLVTLRVKLVIVT